MDVRAVTVTTINTPGTMYGRAIVMVSRARVDQGSTTTGIGVSSVYKKHRFLRSRAQPSLRGKIDLRSTMAFQRPRVRQI